jgi:hypothetical protein
VAEGGRAEGRGVGVGGREGGAGGVVRRGVRGGRFCVYCIESTGLGNYWVCCSCEMWMFISCAAFPMTGRCIKIRRSA